MAIKIKVRLDEIQKYSNLFMLDDILVAQIIKTEKEYIFVGISNSMYKDTRILIQEQEEGKDPVEQTIEIMIPGSIDELTQMQATMKFAYHYFSSSTDINHQEIANMIAPKVAMYSKKMKILALQELM